MDRTLPAKSLQVSGCRSASRPSPSGALPPDRAISLVPVRVRPWVGCWAGLGLGRSGSHPAGKTGPTARRVPDPAWGGARGALSFAVVARNGRAVVVTLEPEPRPQGPFLRGEWRQSCKTNRSWDVRGKGRAWLFLRWRCCLRGEARGDTAQRTTQANPLPEPGAGMASVGHSVMMVLNPASPGAAETAWGSSCLCAPLGAVCPDTRLEAVPG